MPDLTDDAVCVCGHPKSEHARGFCNHKEPLPDCGDWFRDNSVQCSCQIFRAELPWPDSEGWWWCWTSAGVVDWHEMVRSFGFAWREGVLVECCVYLGGYNYHRDDFDRHFGPARFTKLREQNPFLEASKDG